MTKRWRHWAVVGRKSGVLLRDLNGHISIWTHKASAEKDCPKYGRVIRVSILNAEKDWE